MYENNKLTIIVDERLLYRTQIIANIHDMTIEEMVKVLLESYVDTIGEKIKRTTRNLFDCE